MCLDISSSHESAGWSDVLSGEESQMQTERPMRGRLRVLHNEEVPMSAWPRCRRCVFCGTGFAAAKPYQRACTSAVCQVRDARKRRDEADELVRLGLLDLP